MSQVDTIISWAKSKAGSSQWNGYCQRFARQAYEAAGIYAKNGASTATAAWKAWGQSTSKNDIPVGATVYFNGSNPAVGHVAIYIGNGQIVNPAKTVKIQNLSAVAGYRGWGWQAGIKPSGAATETKGGSAGGGSAADAAVSSLASGGNGSTAKVSLNSTTVVAVTGSTGARKIAPSIDGSGSQAVLSITTFEGATYIPLVEEGVTWTTEREGAPSSLTFTVIKDQYISFHEGDTVQLKIDNIGVFYGYVFKKSRVKGEKIEVTAYDQLRYFKNKQTYVYKNKNAASLLQMIAGDFNLQVGACDTPGYTIPSKICDSKTLFDIMGDALDDTLLYTGERYTLWDDFGKLRLTNVQSRMVPYLVDAQTAENFEYTSSIDDEVYNRILVYEDADDGTRKYTIAQDGDHQSRWGILQDEVKLNNGEDAAMKAKILLDTFNRVHRELRIVGALGSIAVRAGTTITVTLNLGDIELNSFMLVEKAVHTIKDGHYSMDLDLVGNLIG